MKKLLIILSLLFLPNMCQSVEIPKDFSIDIPYFSMSFDEAMNRDIPFLLVFATSKNPASIIRFLPLGEMIYKNFDKDFNFSIINTKFEEENGRIIEFFAPKTLPAVYIVDSKNSKYLYVDEKYYNTSDMKDILNKYRTGLEPK